MQLFSLLTTILKFAYIFQYFDRCELYIHLLLSGIFNTIPVFYDQQCHVIKKGSYLLQDSNFYLLPLHFILWVKCKG